MVMWILDGPSKVLIMLTIDVPCKLNVFRHDGHMFGMNGL